MMRVAILGGDVFQYIVNENNFVFFDCVVNEGFVLLLMRQGVEVGNVYNPDKDKFLEQWEKIKNELP
jgi:hypothetical protein